MCVCAMYVLPKRGEGKGRKGKRLLVDVDAAALVVVKKIEAFIGLACTYDWDFADDRMRKREKGK